VITSRRSLLAAFGLALPVAAVTASGAFATTTSAVTPHKPSAHHKTASHHSGAHHATASHKGHTTHNAVAHHSTPKKTKIS